MIKLDINLQRRKSFKSHYHADCGLIWVFQRQYLFGLKLPVFSVIKFDHIQAKGLRAGCADVDKKPSPRQKKTL